MTRVLAAGITIYSLAGAHEGSFTRVRSTVPYVRAMLQEGYARSPVFKDLVDTLQRTNVIVLVQPGLCAGGRIRSCLVSIGGSLVERHIRIKIDPQRANHDRLIAAIGHELQHAVEIAEQPDVFDPATALQLFRRIAFGACHEGLSEECETTRALDTEQHVIGELSSRGGR